MKLRNLDFKTAGFWPERNKKIAFGVAFAIILALGWSLAISGQRAELKQLETKEGSLRDEFVTVQTKANNLDYLKKELVQIKQILTTLIEQLPNKNEIPELVINVSQAAIGNGLQVDLFQPQEEVKKDFYAEKRIDVAFKGDYHKLGSFFSDVALQPRLIAVVVEGMKMTVVPDKKNTNNDGSMNVSGQKDPILDFRGTVRTYRYLSEEEEAEISKAKKAEAAKNKKKNSKSKESNADEKTEKVS